MALQIAEAFVDIKARGLRDVDNAFKKSSRDLKGFAGELDRAGGGLDRLGVRGGRALSGLSGGLAVATSHAGALAAGITAVGVAAVGALGVQSVRAAANLQTSMANVATISTDVRQKLSGVTAQIRQLSSVANVDTRLLSEGLYQTISAGITETGEAMEFLRVSALAAKGGLTTTQTAVDGLSSVINAFGMSASDTEAVADKFFKTVERGKLTFDDISRSIGNVAPLAAQLGVSLDDVLATSASLTLTGQSLSEAFTGIRQIMTAVLRPSEQAKDAAAELGIRFDASALAAQGLVGFLNELSNTAGLTSDKLGLLFGDVQGLNAALALTGNQAATTRSILGDVENAAGGLTNAVSIQRDTFNEAASSLKNEFNLALQALGDKLLPTATEAVQALDSGLKIIDWERHTTDAAQFLSVLGNFAKAVFRPSESSFGGFTQSIADVFIERETRRRAGRQFRPVDPNTLPFSPFGVRPPTTGFAPTLGPVRRMASEGAAPRIPGLASVAGIDPFKMATDGARDAEDAIADLTRQTDEQLQAFEDMALADPTMTPQERLDELMRLMAEMDIALEELKEKDIKSWRKWQSAVNAAQRSVTIASQRLAEERGQAALDAADAQVRAEAESIAAQREGLDARFALERETTDGVLSLERDAAQERIRITQGDFAARLAGIENARAAREKEIRASVADVDAANALVKRANDAFNAQKFAAAAEMGKRVQNLVRQQAQAELQIRLQLAQEQAQIDAQRLRERGGTAKAELDLFNAIADAELAAFDKSVEGFADAEEMKTRKRQIEAEKRTALEKAAAREAATFRLRTLGIDVSPITGGFSATGQPFISPRTVETQRGVRFFSDEGSPFNFAGDIFRELAVETAMLVGRFKGLASALNALSAGGPIAALAAFGAELIEGSESFQRLKKEWETTMAAFSKAIEPLVSAVADSLTPALEALATVAEGLTPVFKALGEIQRAQNSITQRVGETIGGLIRPLVQFGASLISANETADAQTTATRASVDRFGRDVRVREETLTRVRRELEEEFILPGGKQRGTPGRERTVTPATTVEERIERAIVQRERDREDREREAVKERRERERGASIQISNITGPTRDILVDLLSPLKRLNDTFPAMLDELRAIRGLIDARTPATQRGRTAAPSVNVAVAAAPGITPQANTEVSVGSPDMASPFAPAVGGTPAAPRITALMSRQSRPTSTIPVGGNRKPLSFIGFAPMSITADAPNLVMPQPTSRIINTIGGSTVEGDEMTSFSGVIHVHVNQVTDLTVEEIDRQLQTELRKQRRIIGNRGAQVRVN